MGIEGFIRPTKGPAALLCISASARRPAARGATPPPPPAAVVSRLRDGVPRPADGGRTPSEAEPSRVRSRGSRGPGARSPSSVPAARGGQRGPRGVRPAHPAPARPPPVQLGGGWGERRGRRTARQTARRRRRHPRHRLPLPCSAQRAGRPAGPGISCEPGRSCRRQAG